MNEQQKLARLLYLDDYNCISEHLQNQIDDYIEYVGEAIQYLSNIDIENDFDEFCSK